MELIAFLLALVAIWFFFTRPVQFGLVILTCAWVVQLILHWVRIDLVVGK